MHKTLELRRAATRRRVTRISLGLLAVAGGALALSAYSDTAPTVAPSDAAWAIPAVDRTVEASDAPPPVDGFAESVVTDGRAAGVLREAGVEPAETRPTSAPARSGGIVPMPAAAIDPAIAASEAAELRAPREEAGGARLVLRGIVPTAADGCAPEVEHGILGAATLSISVSAPCDPGARLTLAQDGVEVALRLDGDGRAAVDWPALAPESRVTATVIGHPPVEVAAALSDHHAYRRVVLAWERDLAPELHAYEGGAGPGSDGHVGLHMPRTVAHALSGTGGYMVALGDPALPEARMAQVYTLPARGAAALGLEVPITAGNCGEVLAGLLLSPGADGAMRRDAMEIPLPDCGAIGDMLVIDDVVRLRAEG
ncbi:hypothetical protein JQC91_02585 [Jannaschia sp. Os4]|uniref:hypothetical protein n=1 Tax=Jannaschia sp. Os4 TaxID=2807617 RepID=UPI00193A3500|nr:hypothetical protein [Jannaschia sp. Os4]MBM2575181.1 hypothetical protein [Jannaschia sp. Os4]